MVGRSWALRTGFKGIYRDKIDLRVPFEVKRELERKAKEKGLSISDLVRLYIEKCLAEDTPERAR